MADDPNAQTPPETPTGAGTNEDQAGDQAAGSEMPPADWAGLLATLPEDVRLVTAELHEKEIAGLKSTVGALRDEAKQDRAKQQARLADAIKATSAEKDALLAKMQEETAADVARADFYADAHEAGVLDLRTAWAAVREYDLHDRKGNPDLEALKTKCPYLFQTARPAPRTNAGSGTQQPPAPPAEDPLRAAVNRMRG